MGDGIGGMGAFAAGACRANLGRSRSRSCSCCACCCAWLGPTVDTLAVSVDDPDTEDGGEGILPGLSNIDSVRTGEYG